MNPAVATRRPQESPNGRETFRNLLEPRSSKFEGDGEDDDGDGGDDDEYDDGGGGDDDDDGCGSDDDDDVTPTSTTRRRRQLEKKRKLPTFPFFSSCNAAPPFTMSGSEVGGLLKK